VIPIVQMLQRRATALTTYCPLFGTWTLEMLGIENFDQPDGKAPNYSPVHSTSIPVASVVPASNRYAHLHRLWLGARLQLHAIGSEVGGAGLSSKVPTSALRLSICCVRVATSSRVPASSSVVIASQALRAVLLRSTR